MAAFLDVCRFNPTAGGTADWTYSTAVTGYQSPAAAGAANGTVYRYRSESADLSQWEIGYGAYNSSSGTFSRSTVLFNSSATTAKINFSTVPQVAIVALKEDLISIEEANSFTDAQKAQARVNIYAAPFDAAAYNNLAINSRADICQEFAAGATFPTAANNVEKHMADCWDVQYVHGANTAVMQGGVSNAASVTGGPTGFYNMHMLTSTTALSAPANGDYGLLRHKIEGTRIMNLGWGAAGASSLSYGAMVYSSVAVTAFIKFSNSDKSRCYYVDVVLGAGWNFVSGTIPGDTAGTWLKTNGIGLQVEFFGSGKSATAATTGAWSATNTTQTAAGAFNIFAANSALMHVTGLHLAGGLQPPAQAALPYAMRSVDQELALCQRYYEKSFDQGVTPAQAAGSPTNGGFGFTQNVGASLASILPGTVRFAVKKRAVPTVTFYNPGAGNAQARNTQAAVDFSGTSAYALGDGGFGITATSGAGTAAGQTCSVNWVADARL